jgi:hypothetical protein
MNNEQQEPKPENLPVRADDSFDDDASTMIGFCRAAA